jgi:tRNA(fMet)-specific endonuclease VapC
LTRYLLDTNHLSPLIAADHPVRALVLERASAGDSFAIATPVLSEFLFGLGQTARREENQSAWSQLAAHFGYYHIDRQDAEAAAELRLRLRAVGRQLALVDALVAVIALRHGLILLTTDSDFAPIPGLSQENWWLPRA